MFANSLLMSAALAFAVPLAPHNEPLGEPTIDNCQLASIEDQAVPGADAGVLVKLTVKEGSFVKRDAEVAQIDDREAVAQMTVKQLDLKVAQQEADSTVGVRYATETANVNKAALDKLHEANRQSKSTVTDIEIQRTRLEWEKAKLQIEKAREESLSAKLSADAKKAEVDASEVIVKRRVLRAPFNGVVVKIYRHVGEWVSPGEPVVQIVRIDRLRVSGNVDAANWSPADIEGREVTVEVALPRGKTQTVPGKVVFVSPVVALGHELPIWAEIDVPMQNHQPLVWAGLKAKMTIHVDRPRSAEPEAVPAKASARPATPARGKSAAKAKELPAAK